jgi:hypothetical protein
MFASVADLARFGAFVRGNPVGQGRPPLSDAVRLMLWQPAVGPSRGFFHFGFWNGGRTLVTNGNISGANAHLAIGRDADVVVAVAVNQTGNDADEAAGAIVDLLFHDAPAGPDIRAEYAALYEGRYQAPAALLGRWSGAVVLVEGSLPIELEARADSILVRLGPGEWMPLSRPRLSVFGEIRGSVTAEVPGLTLAASGAARIDLVLRWEGDVLRGYLLPRETSALPAAVRLERSR